MIHAVEGFGVVYKAAIGDFLELSGFFDDPADIVDETNYYYLVLLYSMLELT